ncbi:MAG: hypothetical protein ABIU11_07600 [Chitinophagaceae bacterium]
MNVQINQLVKSLLHKDSIEQCSIEELQEYADKHPYFGAAQLLLAKKMKAENDEHFNNQLQKTFLFFHNPLWVENLLEETGNAKITMTDPADIIEQETELVVTPKINDLPPLPAETKNQDSNIYNAENHENKSEQLIISSAIETEVPDVIKKSDEEIISIPLPKIESFENVKAEFTFEPYHTVDYFASQGIKFKEEDKPVDKFGQQLKSFTDWLKIMKRLPVSEIAKTLQPAIEQKVDQLAEHSLQDRDVITEAMAEVWEKQGNTTKAIEIYGKLSLLDPPKSTYFAAKIEGLKKNN